MKAQVLTSFAGPKGLELRDVAAPTITQPNQIRMKVHACGVCHRDITWCSGKFGHPPLPRIMGQVPALLEHFSDVEVTKFQR